MTARRPALRAGTPIWIKPHGQRKQIYDRLTGHHRTDVAIVGGGITGALVAEAFTRAGVSVTVLEAGLVGGGSTAASSALLLREPDRGLSHLTERYGTVAGQQIWRISSDAVNDFVERLRRLRIGCDLVRRDAVHFGATGESVERLERELALRQKLGFGGRWLTPGALRRLTAVPGRGAILTTGHAQFNPYKACLGLFHAVTACGARVHERSGVTRIRNDRNGVRLYSGGATVDARQVVIATGYATPRFRPLVGRFTMFRTYVLATAPLSAAQRREVGFGEVMLWDTERPYHYARWTPDHRLLLGGGDRPVVSGFRRSLAFARATQQLRNDFETLLPALGEVEIDAAWDGLFALTPDSLPYIGPHRHYPAHLFALGYGGNGMTFSFLAARLLLDYWRGKQSLEQRLFGFGRDPS